MPRRYFKIKPLSFLFLLILVSFAVESCGKKIYPSGLEGNLLEYQKNYNQQQRKRDKIARVSDRKYRRELRQERRPYVKEAKRFDKERKEFVKDHIARQEPHVQERMKRNFNETKKYYSSQRTLKDKLVFWKKNKCPYGIG